MEQKNLLTRIGEAIDQHQKARKIVISNSQVDLFGANGERRRQKLLPTPGNVIFTLLLIGGLLIAQNSGAFPLFAAPNAQTASTGTIAYQGRLADAGGNPLTDTVNMTFRLYAAAGGGAPLWEEQWTGANSVQVSDGLFNVMLGSVNPIGQAVITGNSNLFLGITVGTDSEMSPRVQLGSVPFATQALTVPDGSITAEKLAAGAVTKAKLDTNSVFRLLGETTCNHCGNSDEQGLTGWHTFKGNNVNQPIEVTVSTNGGNVMVQMTGRYRTTPATGRWCAVYVSQNGQDVRRALLDGNNSNPSADWGCSASYVFNDLPAGTYTFRAAAWLSSPSDVTWTYNRQIAVYEF